jgi:hypothetical protein
LDVPVRLGPGPSRAGVDALADAAAAAVEELGLVLHALALVVAAGEIAGDASVAAPLSKRSAFFVMRLWSRRLEASGRR